MKKTESTTYNLIINAIVKEQENVIGPLAWNRAQIVKGLILDGKILKLQTNANAKEVLSELVLSYSELFGESSIELSKEVIEGLKIKSSYLPKILV